MIQRLLLLAAVSASFVATALAQQSDFFCDTCDKVVVLDKDDRACLQKKIDKYLDEAKQTNPVLIVLVGCDDASKSLEDSTKLSRDTSIEITGEPGATAAGEPSIFFLTGRQLTCLKKRLPDLVADSRDSVTFDFTACPAEPSPWPGLTSPPPPLRPAPPSRNAPTAIDTNPGFASASTSSETGSSTNPTKPHIPGHEPGQSDASNQKTSRVG